MDEKTHKPESARLRRWAVVAELPNGEMMLAPGRYEGKSGAELCAMICVERYKHKFLVVEVAEPGQQNGALDNSRESSSLQRTGSPALPCLERPTRAGWWVAWNAQNGYPTTYYVCDRLLRAPGELFVWLDDDWCDPCEVIAAGWSGPLESPKAFKAATPENDKLTD